MFVNSDVGNSEKIRVSNFNWELYALNCRGDSCGKPQNAVKRTLIVTLELNFRNKPTIPRILVLVLQNPVAGLIKFVFWSFQDRSLLILWWILNSVLHSESEKKLWTFNWSETCMWSSVRMIIKKYLAKSVFPIIFLDCEYFFCTRAFKRVCEFLLKSLPFLRSKYNIIMKQIYLKNGTKKLSLMLNCSCFYSLLTV